jgi:hypothetical protein
MEKYKKNQIVKVTNPRDNCFWIKIIKHDTNAELALCKIFLSGDEPTSKDWRNAPTAICIASDNKDLIESKLNFIKFGNYFYSELKILHKVFDVLCEELDRARCSYVDLAFGDNKKVLPDAVQLKPAFELYQYVYNRVHDVL